MLTRHQERALRSVCRNGGKVTLPGKNGPITVEVTRRVDPAPSQPGNLDATISYPNGDWSRLNDWQGSELYIEIAERLDGDVEAAS